MQSFTLQEGDDLQGNDENVVGLSGAEGRNIIGELAEDEILAFFQRVCGWKLIFRNVDARLGLRTLEGFEIADRGLDFLFAAPNPFILEQPEGVIVETKRVKDRTAINVSKLEKYIDTLKDKVAAARMSNLQRDEDVRNNIRGAIRYGLLAQRYRSFDLAHYIATLSQVDTSKHRGTDTPVILLLSNDRLSAFVELHTWARGQPIEFYYPKYLGDEKPIFVAALSVNYLFSDIVLGRIETSSGYNTFILSFDSPSPESLSLLFEVFQRFHSSEFGRVDLLLFAKGEYDQGHIYQSRLANSDFDPAQTELIVLRQDLSLTYNLAEQL
jgi:hypothetical protein